MHHAGLQMLFESSHQRSELENMHNSAKYTFSEWLHAKTLLLTAYSWLTLRGVTLSPFQKTSTKGHLEEKWMH